MYSNRREEAMAPVQEVQLQIRDEESAREAKPIDNLKVAVADGSGSTKSGRYVWWIKMAVYSTLLLSGQTIATILGRLYFMKGGSSKWLESLVQTMGFPILIPFYFYFSSSMSGSGSSSGGMYMPKPSASLTVRAALYLCFGIATAGGALMSTVALNYLPVSTYSLIGATPLIFTAFFAFFINAQKFTPLIINSIVLLTIASVLLVIDVGSGQGSVKVSKGKYIAGFVCALASSVIVGLYINLTQLSFRKVLKGNPLKVIIELQICTTAVASCIYVIGLFASKDWKTVRTEMHGYLSGEGSYVMNLVGTAIIWQVTSIGSYGLIFEISSVFCNVMSVLGLPIIPILAVFIFNEKMTGVKAIAMVLSVWGFTSYVYQNYLDDKSSRMVPQKDASSEPAMENDDPKSSD